MKRGTFDVPEMGYQMTYFSAFNAPPSLSYSLFKCLRWNFGKIQKFMKFFDFHKFFEMTHSPYSRGVIQWFQLQWKAQKEC